MIQLSRPQSQVFRAPARFRVLVAGRRFGKTFECVSELCNAVWGKPKAQAWYLAPTYRQAKQIAWKELKETVLPYVSDKPNETDLSVQIRGGGMIALRGAENYDSLRGPGLDFAALDEYADMKPAVWTEVIRPMLADRQGRALFIGTPKGMNHFYELHTAARTLPDWASFQFTTLDGGRVTAEELESARQDMDAKTFRQEFLGSFENFNGRTYYCFERAANLAPVAYDATQQLCWSLDFNVNPMCSVIVQTQGTKVEVLDEIVLPNSNTQEACNEFWRRVEPWIRAVPGRKLAPTSLRIYGDAAGDHRQSAAASKSDYTIIKEFFRRIPELAVTYHVPLADPHVRDRVNAMNAKLKSAADVIGMLIDPRCKRLTKDLEQVAWKADANGNMTGDIDKRNKDLTHVSDALGYLVEREFGIKDKPQLFPVTSVGQSTEFEGSHQFERPNPFRMPSNTGGM
jgi:hypothetical protein